MLLQTHYKAEYCDKAIELLSKGDSIASVCTELKTSRKTLYKWRDQNEEFKDALDAGVQASQKYWEDIGRDGITGKIKGFGGTPWVFLMKTRFHIDYSEPKEQKSTNDSIVEQLLLGKK
jgi:hypothetical protein